MEITADKKLYVLLENKKERTQYEVCQMKLIKFFNYDVSEWSKEVKRWCESHDLIRVDEPTEEQLRVYGGYDKYHKAFPPYTHTSDLYLQVLWNSSSSNPRNWIKSKWIIGTILAVLGLLISLL